MYSLRDKGNNVAHLKHKAPHKVNPQCLKLLHKTVLHTDTILNTHLNSTNRHLLVGAVAVLLVLHSLVCHMAHLHPVGILHLAKVSLPQAHSHLMAILQDLQANNFSKVSSQLNLLQLALVQISRIRLHQLRLTSNMSQRA